ncbi:hypothetical protein NPIL_491661 [Nephila pilipes]|uniref:Uncharacterized protein n=1 Tax=Nephila pilipes TaxID=299642 RepID=A0A8X6U9H7_NEPPI|nr:hypothetical protein NPIL_491661 [Nephila pilipes]
MNLQHCGTFLSTRPRHSNFMQSKSSPLPISILVSSQSTQRHYIEGAKPSLCILYKLYRLNILPNGTHRNTQVAGKMIKDARNKTSGAPPGSMQENSHTIPREP